MVGAGLASEFLPIAAGHDGLNGHSPLVAEAPKWVRLLEFALVGMLGLALARLVFAAIAPLGVPGGMPAATPAQIASGPPADGRPIGNPFRVGGAEDPAAMTVAEVEQELEETSLDLVLHGVVVDGDQSTAVIKTPDGRQQTFATGDEIWEGVFLDAARQDQVTIRRAGVRETLTMLNRDRPQAGADPTAIPTSTPAAVADPAIPGGGFEIGEWRQVVQITPRPAPGGVELVLSPGQLSARFEEAGLRSGDVLVAVNGRRIAASPDKLAEQIGAFSASRSLDLTVARDGVELPLQIFSKPGRGNIDDY